MPTDDKIVAATLTAALLQRHDDITPRSAVAVYRQVLAELGAEPDEAAGGDPEGLDVPKVG